MQAIFGILVMFMFIGAASGSVSQDIVVCKFNQNSHCYVSLGQKVQLKIPVVDIFNLFSSSQNTYILKYSKKQKRPPIPNNPRWKFVIEDNSVMLNSAESSDSETYTIDTFDAKSTEKQKYTLQLHTEAEVSSVSVWYSCSPTEDIKVYCSADGDDLTYSWTSDFHTISQVENGTITQTLSKEYHGNVTCYVKNHVSQSQRSIVVQPCQEPTTTVNSGNFSTNFSHQTGMISKEGYTTNTTQNTPSESVQHTITLLGVFCVIIILIFIAEIYMHRTKKSQKTEEAPPQYDEGELKQEP